jgi:hypothetical protein
VRILTAPELYARDCPLLYQLHDRHDLLPRNFSAVVLNLKLLIDPVDFGSETPDVIQQSLPAAFSLAPLKVDLLA